MIHPVLFKREAKANWRLLVIFLAVLTMYGVTIVTMFDPELGESLTAMADSMPQLFAAFGMNEAGATLTAFVSNYLYGFLLLAFPLVFIIILANRLLARYVDSGSMAYLLASPVKRIRLARSQALFLFLCSVILTSYVTLLIIITGELLFPGQLDLPRFLLLNVGLLGLLTFFSGICFCTSALFNETKKSYGVSAGLTIAFLLIQMLANTGDRLDALKYATPITLFDPKGILAGAQSAAFTMSILYLAGILLFILGIRSFSKRDLPI
jgi:ABC-2 type transport system permease protein